MKPLLSPALRALGLTAAVAVIFGQAVAAEAAPTSTLITGATIFDGTSEKLITGKPPFNASSRNSPIATSSSPHTEQLQQITGNNGKVLALSRSRTRIPEPPLKSVRPYLRPPISIESPQPF